VGRQFEEQITEFVDGRETRTGGRFERAPEQVRRPLPVTTRRTCWVVQRGLRALQF
jgi:hypothetical protein